MTLTAKFLAFLNILAACGFLYLATLDFNARRVWAYEVFRAELAIDGLPVDDKDPGPRRVETALYHDLEDHTIKDMFAKAGGNPIKPGDKPVLTQADELARMQKIVMEELEQLKGDDVKLRARLKELALPLAYNLQERDFWYNHIADKDAKPADLIADFNKEFFERPKETETTPSRSDWLANRAKDAKGKAEPKPEYQTAQQRREMIAHVLFNLTSKPDEHYRVMTVVGLRQYVKEADAQAERLREMSQHARVAMLDERQIFETEYTNLVQRILTMVEEIDLRKQFMATQKSIKDRNIELKTERMEDLKVLEAKLAAAQLQVNQALALQGELETQLFAAQKQLGGLKAQTEELERYISGLEVRTRR